jgi:hypothetical protein
LNIARICLTQGNLNNNHFYLTSCLAMFPADSIGGSNAKMRAGRLLKIKPLGDENVETDIDGTKNIFRKRGWVGEMFRREGARLGDLVCIKQNDEDSYEIWLEKFAANS